MKLGMHFVAHFYRRVPGTDWLNILFEVNRLDSWIVNVIYRTIVSVSFEGQNKSVECILGPMELIPMDSILHRLGNS